MSLPPQIIRVKRKRVEETPVTFLQLDEGTKRHRSGSNWVYQRRGSAAAPGRREFPVELRPVIHIPTAISARKSKANALENPKQMEGMENKSHAATIEPRRFHVSRAMLAAAGDIEASPISSKKAKLGPTVFVERTGRRKVAKKPRSSLAVNSRANEADHVKVESGSDIPAKALKKTGIANRSRQNVNAEPRPNPLPLSLMNRHNEDMDKIAADMNEWVLKEVGAHLQSIEEDKKREEKMRFRPKAPSQRYEDRHAEQASHDVEMGNAPLTDEEEQGNEEDWVIEEYIRVPAYSLAQDVLPSEVGFLVLEGEADSLLFYGHPEDDDDDFAEDDEDENAENHYTADYPEDEVDSDDEYDRHAYWFRNKNASDDEEYDEDEFDDQDDMAMDDVLDGDDDARMARIVAQIKQQRAATRGI